MYSAAPARMAGPEEDSEREGVFAYEEGDADDRKVGVFATCPFESTEVFVPKKPPEDVVLRRGELKKRIVSKRIYWAPRTVTLTSSGIFLAKDVGGDPRDELDLLDLTSVQSWDWKEAHHDTIRDMGQRKLSRISSIGSLQHGRDHPAGRGQVKDSLPMQEQKTVDEHEWQHVLELQFEVLGRTYYLKASSEDECHAWIEDIQSAHRAARAEAVRELGLSVRIKRSVAKFYDHPVTQASIGLLLLTNFLISIVQLEMESAQSGDNERIFVTINYVFTVIYTCELAINMYGHWFWPFFTSFWGLFDLVIVSVSLFEVFYVDLYLSSMGTDAGGSGLDLNLLRLLRIFRVVRVFNKLKVLQKILVAMRDSFAPVLSTFVLLAVVLSIYAIVATNLFRDRAAEVGREDAFDEHMSAYYGSFFRAFVSLLGIATGYDSWTAEVRRLGMDAVTIFFYVSFVVVVSIVTINVIVAVLLEGFISSMHASEERKLVLRNQQRQNKLANAFDPLLATLANFTGTQHLRSQFDILFSLWDIDDNGSVDFEEVRCGIRKLGYSPAIEISSEDWDQFTLNGALCDQTGGVNLISFEIALEFQMALYAQRLVATKMTQSIEEESELAPMFYVLKIMVLHLSAEYFRSKLKDVDEAQVDYTSPVVNSPVRSDSPLASAETRFWVPPKSCVNSFTRHVAYKKKTPAQATGHDRPVARFIGDSDSEEEAAEAVQRDVEAEEDEEEKENGGEENDSELGGGGLEARGLDDLGGLWGRRQARAHRAAEAVQRDVEAEEEEEMGNRGEENDSELGGGGLEARGDDLKWLMERCKAMLAKMSEERAQMQEMMTQQREILKLMLAYTGKAGGFGPTTKPESHAVGGSDGSGFGGGAKPGGGGFGRDGAAAALAGTGWGVFGGGFGGGSGAGFGGGGGSGGGGGFRKDSGGFGGGGQGGGFGGGGADRR